MAKSENKRRTKGEGSLEFNEKKKKWVARITAHRADGSSFRKTFEGKTQKEAKSKRDEWLRHYKEESERIRSNEAFGKYVNEWMENMGRNGIKAQTYKRNVRTIRTYVVPYLGEYSLSKLDTKTIQLELVNRMANEPNAKTKMPNSFSTIKKPYDIVHACLSYAVKVGDIASNPCDNVVLPKERKSDARQIRPLTDEEAKRFIKACSMGVSSYEWVCELILYTGLRMGEACALCPSDINLKESYINVHATLIEAPDRKAAGTGFVYQNKTKTNKDRMVYLGSRAKELLEERLETCPAGCYLANQKTFPTNLIYLGREYKKVCKRAKIDNVVGLHDLRHTFATKLIRAGVDIKTVSEQLGHSTISFTLKTYVHTVESEKVEKMQALNWA